MTIISKKVVVSALTALMLLGGTAGGIVGMSAPAQAKPIKFPFPKGPHPGWGGGHWGWGVGGLAAGLAIGAIAAQNSAASEDCGYVDAPYYDQYGNLLGYRAVPTC